jgi:predicted SnoaL-like aldol condensation-catalyzing enzyme
MTQPQPKPQATTASIKEAAEEFMRLVAKGEVKQAYDKFIAPGFRHHNPYFRGDADSLRAAMEESQRKNPHKVLEIQRSLQDGDLVAIHSRIKQSPGDNGGAAVHIFRFKDGRIEELWDIGQPMPQDCPNQHGMF